MPVLIVQCVAYSVYVQVAATVRAMREESPTVPTAIAEIVGQYMASRDWEETGARLAL